ncbi:MAG TPA: hypothetical protein VJX10_01635 [Pseudonocardiaceae bacterium]|nr:hypothetical protein [Pseudonocardiaceae bacterium]
MVGGHSAGWWLVVRAVVLAVGPVLLVPGGALLVAGTARVLELALGPQAFGRPVDGRG